VPENSSDRESLWLLKSTYYADFRRRILTLLSLPRDSLYEVEYDSRWIDDELKSRTSALRGKDTCFIFLDYASSPLQFYPIRSCKIQDIQPGEPYRLILKVGNLPTLSSLVVKVLPQALHWKTVSSKSRSFSSVTGFGWVQSSGFTHDGGGGTLGKVLLIV